MPTMIKGDNGRDYLSEQYQNLLKNLGIRYDKATAYAGEEKGGIERAFRTIQHSYVRVLAGFIGHNVAHRQKIEQQIAKKDRGAKDKYGNAIMTQTCSDELLNWEQFDDKLQEAVYLWEIDKVRRKGPSPVEVWNSCSEPIHKITYDSFLIYAGGYRSRTVQKDAINYNGGKYQSTFISKYRGHKVFVSENIDDISELFVFDENGSIIGVVRDRKISPMTAEELSKVRKGFTKDVKHIQKTIRDAKTSSRTKENIKTDLARAKQEVKDSLAPEKETLSANIKLQKDVREKRAQNFLNEASEVIVKEDVFLKYG